MTGKNRDHLQPTRPESFASRLQAYKYDQRHFDNGDRNRQHERAEQLAHPVRYYFSLEHGHEHGGD